MYDIMMPGERCAPRSMLSSSLASSITLTNPSRGIIVPGGFGHRGTEGMVAAVKWAREQKVPFLGICLGFQVAVIEWARNVVGLKGEFVLSDDMTKRPLN